MIVVSLLLVAAGAILRYAVESNAWDNFSEDTMGMVLLVVGAIGLVYGLVMAAIAANTTKRVVGYSEKFLRHEGELGDDEELSSRRPRRFRRP